MHPNAAFRFRPDDPVLAFVAAYGFAHIFAMTYDGPRIAHAPLLVTPAGNIRFHLANDNALAAHLDGEPALLGIGGPGSYVSPNWYADPAQHVPTWNYRSVEIEGQVRVLSFEALGELLDQTASTFEPCVEENWTMAKMQPERRNAMMRAITGFELVPNTICATDKASQNRNEVDARAVVNAMERIGDMAGAAAIRRTRGW
jgi:transcriptional regulator